MLKNALSFHQKGELGIAADLYRKILAQNPKNSDALHLLGVIELQRKNLSTAVALISRAIEINSNNAAYFSNLGLALQGLNRFDGALDAVDRALTVKRDYADAHNHRGNILRHLKRFDEALASYTRALAVKPDYVDALNNRGAVLSDLERWDHALASYDRALAIKSDYAEALNNRGVALSALARFDDAIASYDRALAIMPDYAEALNNRGNALSELACFVDALASYDRALAVKPDYPEALYNRGVALNDLKRFDDAIASYDRALAVKPDYAEALNGRGVVLNELKRFDGAIASYDFALEIKPDYAEALYNRGNALGELKRFEEAIASYDQVLAIKPDYEFLLGSRLFCKMQSCDWRAIADDFERIANGIAQSSKPSMPAIVLATPLSATLQREWSEKFIRAKHPENPLLPKLERPYEHSRIRLGYFSADFYDHATANLITGLFECHDRTQFEVFAFSFGPAKKDAMRARLEKSFEAFLEVGVRPDQDIALLARDLEIDIAIDLKGFTQGSRTGIFAMRPAPVQVNYLGYPGTMGATYIDYLIADRVLIPEDQQQHYAERIVYLPNSYQANDAKRLISDKQFTRADCGLPENGFVFCCFNNSYKISPKLFEIWMRLLKAVDGSVLWLLEDNVSATRNLRAEAHAGGVGPEKLVFAKRIEVSEHLARHRLADLFLDTLPYNAHTGASDALWTGLPILTCLGDTFAGRVAASLLNAIGLPELVATSLDEYSTMALKLAADSERLQMLRKKLAANRITHPLFNTGAFTHHIESAYVSMWDRNQRGLTPQHIHIQHQ